MDINRRRWLAAVLLGLLTFLHALGAAGKPAELPPLHVKVGDKAPDFALPSSYGKPIKLSDYAGRKVLIDFYRGYW